MPTAVVSRGLTQIADYDPGAVFGPRALADFEFVWMVHGSADWIVDGRPIHLRPGTLSLASPSSTDAYRWDPERPVRHAYVHFVLLDQPATEVVRGWPRTRSVAETPVLGSLCDYLIALGSSGDMAAGRRTNAVLALLLDIFLAGPLPALTQALPPVVVAAAEHVRRDWSRSGMRIIEVGELAEAAHVSSGHLFRLFRELGPNGPTRALELVRLSRAAVALQRSNASLSEIAARCGFANAYHFSRRFSRSYGMPPGRFRAAERMLDPMLPVQEAGLLPLVRLVVG